MKHSELELQSTDGLRLYAQEWAPDGEVTGLICLVHGLGEHSGRYAHMAEYFSSNGFAMISIDLRGHGKSAGQRGHSPSLEVMNDDFSLFLETARERFPNQHLFLYGHSLGGNLVLNYTIRSTPSIKALISSGPLLRPAFEPPAWKITVGRLLYSLLPTLAMSNELDRDALSKDPKVVEAYNADPLVHDRISSRLAIDMLDTGLWLLENAKLLRIPTLIVHGSGDRICSATASQEFAQKAGEICTLKLFDGLFHEIHNEPEKETVFAHVLSWIHKQLAA
jgi:alpha-beta hydrolase superfamily lysophospholipase